MRRLFLWGVLLLWITGCTIPPRRVATDATFPPFHFVTEEGIVTGFDVEVARTALRRAGRPAEVVRVQPYEALFTGLEDGDHDLVAATTGITPERQTRFSFTRPYFVTCQAIVVRDADGPATVAELAGARVAAPTGTTSVAAARGIGAAEVLEMPGVEGAAALRDGLVDALVADEFEAVRLARETPGLRVLRQPAASESYGLVLRRGDVMVDRLNDALAAMEEDGTLSSLRRRFGLGRPADWPVQVHSVPASEE